MGFSFTSSRFNIYVILNTLNENCMTLSDLRDKSTFCTCLKGCERFYYVAFEGNKKKYYSDLLRFLI